MQKVFYYIGFVVFLYSCANPVAPSGGVKDVTPPKVLLTLPQNEMINYRGNEIVLRFDEYFSLVNSLDKILITPAMPTMPKFSVKGKDLVIRLPENLSEQTTYSLTFIDAIKDYNEGNALSYYKYIFSTGDYIDSFSLSGKVISSFDGKGVDKITVGLYRAEDLDSIKVSTPLYVVRTEANGSFLLDNVKEDRYVVLALNDKNLNYIFDQISEDVSMPSEVILINDKLEMQEDIVLFSTYINASIEDYKLLGYNSLSFIFNQEVSSIYIDLQEGSDQDLAYFGRFQDTLYYSWADTLVKELHFSFLINDSIRDSLTIALNKNKMDQSIKLAKAETDVIVLACPFDIVGLDCSLISLKDSLGKIVAFNCEYEHKKLVLKGVFEKDMDYKLFIDEAAIAYFNGRTNAFFDKQGFAIKEAQGVSNLNLSYTSSISDALVLELYKDDIKLRVQPLQGGALALENLPAGNYKIRIFEDANGDGRWTTGNFDLGIAPEKVLFYSQVIEMKTNWDKDLNLSF